MVATSSSMIFSFAATLFLLLFTWVWQATRSRRSQISAPPGPRGVPLLGSLFDIPPGDIHLTFFNMARKYGPLFQFVSLGKTFVVVSDWKTANELLDGRGAIYSDRPSSAMIKASGYDWNFGTMRPDQRWRARMKLVSQRFSSLTPQMRVLLHRSTLELAKNLIRSPHNFRHHIQRQSAANIMSFVYGIRIKEENDPYVDIVERGVHAFSDIVMPGANIVDMLPFLLRIPSWLPILGYWTRSAEGVRKCAHDMIEAPYARAKRDMLLGVASPCMVTEDHELMQDDPTLTEQVIKESCATAYFAGGETSVSLVLSFVMAMVLWPEYQKTAQNELDRTLGNRLPEFDDANSLPYVEAIIRETYRAFPITPLNFPHALERDDVYQGFLLRKGTTVLTNLWAMMHDENVYDDPHTFNPGRWIKNGAIDPQAQDPRAAGTFGFGRRTCPGRSFADASVFITIATLLKCFDFGVHVDHGVEMPPNGRFSTGMVSCPVPFRCEIRLHSDTVQSLIETALEAMEN